MTAYSVRLFDDAVSETRLEETCDRFAAIRFVHGYLRGRRAFGPGEEAFVEVSTTRGASSVFSYWRVEDAGWAHMVLVSPTNHAHATLGARKRQVARGTYAERRS